jgi:hypothetical protein
VNSCSNYRSELLGKEEDYPMNFRELIAMWLSLNLRKLRRRMSELLTIRAQA